MKNKIVKFPLYLSWTLYPEKKNTRFEADSKDQVVETAKLLGFEEEQLTGENTVRIYNRYGINLDDITNLRFI